MTIYPTGGGTGIVGIMKAFKELKSIGLISDPFPKMIAVQPEECSPIVRAYKENKEYSGFFENSKTIAPGLRVPKAIGDYLILQAIRETKGTAISVNDTEIKQAMSHVSSNFGLFFSPEAAANFAAYKNLFNDNQIDRKDKVVILATATGLTTPNLWV